MSDELTIEDLTAKVMKIRNAHDRRLKDIREDLGKVGETLVALGTAGEELEGRIAELERGINDLRNVTRTHGTQIKGLADSVGQSL
jgi:hypothetical protein